MREGLSVSLGRIVSQTQKLTLPNKVDKGQLLHTFGSQSGTCVEAVVQLGSSKREFLETLTPLLRLFHRAGFKVKSICLVKPSWGEGLPVSLGRTASQTKKFCVPNQVDEGPLPQTFGSQNGTCVEAVIQLGSSGRETLETITPIS